MVLALRMNDERKVKMHSIRNDFTSRSGGYDDEIARSVPNYAMMLEYAVGSLPFDPDAEPHIFDLGTGTGALSVRILERYPNCHLTCVDMTAEMLKKARARIGDRAKVHFLEKDFYELELPEGLDAVVSSLALHHLVTDEDKRSFYAKVRNALRPGGVFVNADAVLGSDDWLESLYKKRWKAFMRANLDEKVIEAILERHRREDSLPKLMDQLEWLSEAGFSKVDVVWKDHMGAVVWARR